MIDACLLGIGGMMPLADRWLSSLLLRCRGEIVLCDCGEGTQISWKHTNWGFRAVSTIVLSHLHADHVAGLPGVLYMIAHSGRTEPVRLFGPPGTARAVAAMRVIVPYLPYPVEIQELSGGERVQLDNGLELRALTVDHRVPCLAYTFYAPRAPRFLPERARALGIPVDRWKHLQQGETVTVDGRTIDPAEVTGPPRRGLTVSYVTDTRPTPELPGFVAGADLLVCEGMYGDPEAGQRAVERGHMLMQDAAAIAAEAGVCRLWITHVSPAVEDPHAYLPLVREIFPAAEIGQPHETLTLAFRDE